jgi:dipeptidase E
MVNLAFYSDQIIAANEAIDKRLLAMLASKGPGRRIGYVASGPEPDRRFFRERSAYYARYGLDLQIFHDLDAPDGGKSEAALFSCDAIHLSGGHTAGFLARLKRGGMISRLRDWAVDGGVLVGTSAGAIIMTPTIATDALFTGNAAEEMMTETGLDLVPFEFFPHFGARPTYLADLIRYSRLTARPIIACNDGDGVVVTQGRIECIGQPLWIENGEASAACDLPLSEVEMASGAGGK